jgi:lysophospholipase L1-like esterase
VYRLSFILLYLLLPLGALRAQPAPTPPVLPGGVSDRAVVRDTVLDGLRNLAPPEKLRIVVLGSSTAAGQGASEEDSAWVWKYRTYLSAIDPDWEVINLAVGGYTTYQVQPTGWQWPAGRPRPDTAKNITHALSLHPSAIIINLPTNDAASGFSIIEQTENFERLSAEASRAGIPLWVSTTQPRDLPLEKRWNLMTMRDWIGERFPDRVLDFWTGLATDDGLMLDHYDRGDGIHLNDAGHALLLTRVRDEHIPEQVTRINWIARNAPRADGVQVWPNPTRGRATIHFFNGESGPISLIVQDRLGRTVLRQDDHYAFNGDFTTALDFGTLPSGSYLLLLHTPHGTRQHPLLLLR